MGELKVPTVTVSDCIFLSVNESGISCFYADGDGKVSAII